MTLPTQPNIRKVARDRIKTLKALSRDESISDEQRAALKEVLLIMEHVGVTLTCMGNGEWTEARDVLWRGFLKAAEQKK